MCICSSVSRWWFLIMAQPKGGTAVTVVTRPHGSRPASHRRERRTGERRRRVCWLFLGAVTRSTVVLLQATTISRLYSRGY